MAMMLDKHSFCGCSGGANHYASEDYPFIDCTKHWMNIITLISDMNHHTVEACILLEAGQLVDESAMTDENCLHEMMQVAHMQLLHGIPSERFESEAVQDVVLLQLKGGKAKDAMFTGKTLWRQQKEVHKSVKNLASEMPGAASSTVSPVDSH